MLESLLTRVAKRLDERAIPYMVIGGQAVLLYGEPRHTKDVDITLGVGPEEAAQIIDLAAACGCQVLAEAPVEFVQQTLVLPCADPESGLRLDLVFSFSPYEQEAIARSTVVSVDGVPVHFATKEDLLIHKIVAGRPRDIEDVRAVLLKNPDVDLDLVRHWLAQFEKALDEPLLARLQSVLQDAGREDDSALLD